MKLVVGVHDLDGGAIVAAVAFDEWDDAAEASRTEPPVLLAAGSSGLCVCPVPLTPDADYCYPSDFVNSPLLHAVAAPLRQARAAEIEFAQSESAVDRQTRATNFVLAEVRKLSGLDIQTFEDLPAFLNRPVF